MSVSCSYYCYCCRHNCHYYSRFDFLNFYYLDVKKVVIKSIAKAMIAIFQSNIFNFFLCSKMRISIPKSNFHLFFSIRIFVKVNYWLMSLLISEYIKIQNGFVMKLFTELQQLSKISYRLKRLKLYECDSSKCFQFFCCIQEINSSLNPLILQNILCYISYNNKRYFEDRFLIWKRRDVLQRLQK